MMMQRKLVLDPMMKLPWELDIQFTLKDEVEIDSDWVVIRKSELDAMLKSVAEDAMHYWE